MKLALVALLLAAGCDSIIVLGSPPDLSYNPDSGGVPSGPLSDMAMPAPPADAASSDGGTDGSG